MTSATAGRGLKTRNSEKKTYKKPYNSSRNHKDPKKNHQKDQKTKLKKLKNSSKFEICGSD